MARARITDQSEEPMEAVDTTFEDVSTLHDTQQNEMDELAIAFGDVPNDVRMHFVVHKIRPNSKITDKCFEGTREDLPVDERIRTKYGPGTYRIYIMKNNRLVKTVTMGIAPELTPPPGPSTENVLLKELLETMKQQIAAKPITSNFNMESLPAIITAGAAALTAIKSLLPPPPPPSSMKDTMDLILVAKQLVDNGGSERETSWTDLIAKFASPEMLSTLASMRGPQQIPAQQQPLALSGPAQPQPTPEQVQQAQIAQLKTQLDFMIGRAQHNSDPALYADLMEDTLPSEFVTRMKQPGAYEILLAINPGIATYAAWFQAVLHALATPAIDESDDELPLTHDDLGGGQGAPNGAQARVPQRGPASFTAPQHSSGQYGHAGNAQGDDEEGEGGED